jgi:DNA-binding NarL/FixJ family response regulator
VGLATQSFRLGASGYVLKHAAAEELVVAIREAVAGRTYITPRIANEVLQNLMSQPGDPAKDGSGLTGREREVLQLLAEGKIIKEIAAILSVSPRTVEFHKNNIVVKTGLRTNAELARYAARHGLVSESSLNSSKTSWLPEGSTVFI